MRRTAIILAVGAAGWLAACAGEQHVRETVKLPSVSVQTAAAREVEWRSTYEAVGNVQARTTATLSSKVMGYVREIKADAGDRVRAGQELIVLDSRDLDAGYGQARAGLAEARSAMAEVENAIAAAQAQQELAEATFRRMEDLHAKKSVTEQEYDEASAKLRMAKASREMAVSRKDQLTEKIRQAEQALESAAVLKSYAAIAAPFDGTIIARTADPGTLAAPGMPLLTIERAGSYRLEARVAESWLPRIRPGQEVEVELDAFQRKLSARVSEIVPAVDAASRAFIVRINLPAAADLRSGLFGRAKFGREPRKVVAVPAAAVVMRGQVQSVYAIKEGVARNRLVKLGEERDGWAEVLSGLSAGEQVVSPVPAGLADGAPVEVRP